METLQNSVTKFMMDFDLEGIRAKLESKAHLFLYDCHTSLVNDDIKLTLNIQKHSSARIYFYVYAVNTKNKYWTQLLTNFYISETTLQKMTKKSLCKKILGKLLAEEFCEKDLRL